jgi:hypothetical protein
MATLDHEFKGKGCPDLRLYRINRNAAGATAG